MVGLDRAEIRLPRRAVFRRLGRQERIGLGHRVFRGPEGPDPAREEPRQRGPDHRHAEHRQAALQRAETPATPVLAEVQAEREQHPEPERHARNADPARRQQVDHHRQRPRASPAGPIGRRSQSGRSSNTAANHETPRTIQRTNRSGSNGLSRPSSTTTTHPSPEHTSSQAGGAASRGCGTSNASFTWALGRARRSRPQPQRRHEGRGRDRARHRPDFEHQVVRIDDLLARLGELVAHVGPAEVPRSPARPETPRTLGDDPPGATQYCQRYNSDLPVCVKTSRSSRPVLMPTPTTPPTTARTPSAVSASVRPRTRCRSRKARTASPTASPTQAPPALGQDEADEQGQPGQTRQGHIPTLGQDKADEQGQRRRRRGS